MVLGASHLGTLPLTPTPKVPIGGDAGLSGPKVRR